jgi:SAM-dependent methyltransferase
MQAYGQDFANIYNVWWQGYTKQVAPLILGFYESTQSGQANKSILDLCCGTGHLMAYFLERGYRALGIDLSEYMLDHARENASQYLESGQGKFVKSDASDFTLRERFGLVVSTYDSINHLEDEQALIKCFQCVHAVNDGYFIFDMNTREGLKRWNNTKVDEISEDTLIITRGVFDDQSDRAGMRITGFIATTKGLYKRFDETVYNTVFSMERVKEALLESGWKNVHFAGVQDLSVALSEPEELGRVFVVASK